MHRISNALEYLVERQPLRVLGLHLAVFCLVLIQIVVSNFIGFTDNGEISKIPTQLYGTWIHIGTGLSLLPIAFLFIYVELKRHGLKYFYPYLYGNLSQLKEDIKQLKQLKLPEPSPCGIAATVHGLGLGALALVILSGLTWFVSWLYRAPWANDAKEFHEIFTALMEAYVLGHGGMGLLHLFFK